MTQDPATSSLEGDSGQSSSVEEPSTNNSLEHVDEHKKVEHQEAHEGSVPPPAEGHEALQVCRVCQCVDPDPAGDAALKSIGMCFPLHAIHQRRTDDDTFPTAKKDQTISDATQGSVRTLSGERDLEAGACINDSLINLGCACRSDLAVAHYACALRWFVSRDSINCEICGAPALNIRSADRDKVISTLKERYTLLRAGGGEMSSQSCPMNPAAAVSSPAALESVSWFDPHGNAVSVMSRSISSRIINSPSPATKWAIEGTGILIATGLLTVTITWLFAPRIDKGTSRKGLHFLLAGLCALAIVVFLRFGVLPRIKYGPARYWAILVVFWFLIFGVWASSTRSPRTST